MDIGQVAGPSTSTGLVAGADMKRPDKVHPYRLNFWRNITSSDNTSELMNVLGMLLSMMGMLLKYKSCAWVGLLVAGVSYANSKADTDGKQIMTTFMLSMSAVVMCYLANPQPISMYLNQPAAAATVAAAAGGATAGQ